MTPRPASPVAVARPFPLILLVGFLATSGFAAAASVELRTNEPATVEARVVVEAQEGDLLVRAEQHTGRVTITLAEGEAFLVRTAFTGVVRDSGREGVYGAPQKSRTPLPLPPGAVVTLTFDDERLDANVLSNGTSTLSLAASVATSGAPVQAGPAGPTRTVLVPAVAGGNDRPAFECPRGAWLQGAYGGARGWPVEDAADASFRGTFALSAASGTASWLDADGTARSARLGNSVTDAGVAGSGVGGTVEWTTLDIDGDGTVDAPGLSGFVACAPHQVLHVEGATTWRNATGTATDADGRTTAFEAATVAARGAFALRHEAAPGALATTYRAEGDADVFVDGGLVATAAAPPAVSAWTWGAVALLLLALAAKATLGLYSRLATRELLEHAGRRRIYDAVVAEPGLHKREVHRRVGGAWGPFTVNLRLLLDGGYLRVVEAAGRHRLYARGVAVEPALAAIPHPVPRELYATLPADGTPVPLAELRRVLGISHQLAHHHVTSLRALGLVVVDGRTFGPKAVSRATTVAPGKA